MFLNILTYVLALMLVVVVWGFIYDALDPDPDYNNIWICKKCSIASREGIIKLHNKTKEDINYITVNCPHCEKDTKMDRNNNIATPLAPSLSLWQRREIYKTLTVGIYTEEADKQMQSYLKIQKEKLEKMKEGMKNG